jgi:glycyl-tRNA synthetase
MGALGPRFRGKAKAVAEALEACLPGPEGATVVIDGEEVFISPDLYKVREEEVEVPGCEITPHVIEPSYGIDRMIYAVLEHTPRGARRRGRKVRGSRIHRTDTGSVFPDEP